MASPSPDRVSRLRSPAAEFLCSAAPPASLWQSLLGMSSLSHLVLGGRLRMRSLQICLHRSWDRLHPSAPVAWSPDCLRDLRWWLHGDHRIWTFGPTLQTSAGGLTWATELFPAFGTSRRLFFQSMPGSCWQCVAVSSTSSPFCPGPRWRCFATTSPRSPICARREAPGLLLSTPFRRRSSVGWNLFRFGWLPSSFQGSAMFSLALSPVLISSPAPSGLSTWTSFDL